jgi:hypothetical protein
LTGSREGAGRESKLLLVRNVGTCVVVVLLDVGGALVLNVVLFIKEPDVLEERESILESNEFEELPG